MLARFKSFQSNHAGRIALDKASHLGLSFGCIRSRSNLRFGRVQSTAVPVHEDQPGLSSEAIYTANDIPTPTGSSLVSRLASLLFGPSKQYHKSISATFQSTGVKLYRIPFPFMKEPFIATADPEHVAAIFRHDGDMPIRIGSENLVWLLKKHGFGSGLVIDNLDTWKTLRSKSNKQVVPRRILKFTPLIHEVSGDVVKHFKNSRGVDNYVDDVHSPLMDWSFEGMGIFILGERLKFFTDPNERMRRFVKAGVTYINLFATMLSPIPWFKLFPTPSSIQFLDAVREIEQITKELVEEKITKLSGSDSNEGIGFLEQWLLDDKFTMEDMFVLVRDFLAAGIDTSSVAATFMLYELARNPHVQDKLREEVLSVVGEHEVPTVEHLQQLHYCKNIITETLRLHPVTSGNVRILGRDVVLDGYHIPKGATMLMAGYTMTRDPSIFEDPLTFNPDRWTRESKKQKAFASLPFGFGPRACYGRRLVEMELNMLLIQISRHFALSTDMSGLEEVGGGSVLKPLTPVRIQFNDRY